ncbi:MAG: MBL fold metallo-hydrolase, partial [Oscillospiraceae bacterium]|nr:MBL fold metallo-hydrolase [Oscillospiraceae bacterium]
MVTKVTEGIYSFEIVLPNNPLKWLNCYVIKGSEGKNLLIDSGFARPECLESLLAGMEELELTPENTDVLFTHLHSDHTGNGFELHKRGYHILMGEKDYRIMCRRAPDIRDRCKRMGVPEGMIDSIISKNPGLKFAAAEMFPVEFIHDAQLIHYGGRTLECIQVPGHTPGCFVLFDFDNKTLFSSDHVLFDISPNIVTWVGEIDMLGDYMASLLRVRELDVELTLPAHRTNSGMQLYERVDQLIEHHEKRLDETWRVVKENPGATTYQIASMVKWRITAKSWEDFPDGQKWFAVSETMAHLKRLICTGRIRRENGADEVAHFFV